ncbi:N-methyl-L-tryptophan oxidase [Paenibacillus allorhizosphaerae]|uniref:Monomeric sarcosine oxidase n=1 Tax=Paenibacillus allorhizosphaerae TaxID=2849866 RepID=A0ABM8VGG2_9BACL|nr:N-methyl-L-tryptophan oxidase [Paenibacillus allorhizosphaerae]CAG7638543.1 Monomeric sarcosine oxidase [Paenibacillus allorhizosphaerae]
MSAHYEVIVLGAGAMGMAAGYYLAKQGVNTLLIDAFDPPHGYGSHHGDTRIIRHAYGEGRQYVPLALRAQELWEALERESGQKLFRRTGVLGVGSKQSKFIKEAIASANKYHLPLEVLSADEIMQRWPGIRIPEHFFGSFETSSGVLFSEECIRAYRRLAIEAGVVVRFDTPADRVELHTSGASVYTAEGVFHADRLIVTSGAWIGKLLASLKLPLQPVRKTVAWFQSEETLYGEGRFPAFIFDLEKERYYGFPSFDGCGVKLGRNDAGEWTDPDQVDREFGAYPEDEGDVRRFLETHMPQAAGTLKQGKVCLFTLTPDEHFVIDRHPEYAHVAIAGGFSGHGFKFASVVGEIISQLAIGGETGFDLSGFSIARPAIR